VVDETMQSRGNVRLRLYPSNGFANYRWPTVAELNAGLRLEDAVTWDDLDVGVQASDTSDNPPISAKATVETRSTANYGGSIPFWYPGYYTDTSNDLVDIFDLLVPDDDGYDRPALYIAMSVDGEIGEAGQPADTYAFADGDFVTVMAVRADAWSPNVTGDDPFSYTINFLRNGGLAHYTVASTATPTLAITPSSDTLDVSDGDVLLAAATVNGRPFNAGVIWTTADAAVATVSSYGVITPVAAGGPTNITGTLRYYPSATDTVAITVTA
jgi:uncharacterized protein YjdB